MKNLISISALFALSLALTAGNTFEGNLTLTTSKNGTAGAKTVLAVKNDLVAIEPGSNPQMVLNVQTGDFSTVINQGGQKIVAKFNIGVLNTLQEMPAFFGTFSDFLGNKSATSEVKATEETKTIGGYKCKKFIIKDETSVSEIWAAQDFPFSLAALMDLMQVTGSANSALKASFPLQANVKNTKTDEVTGFTVIVEKKQLDEKLFSMPNDLIEMDMTHLVQQMMQTNDPAQIKKVLDSLIPR